MSIEERLAALERRLAALEDRIARLEPPRGDASPGDRGPAAGARSGSERTRWSVRLPSVSASLVLGWAGAAALVLAAAYLVRLGIDYGWLTADLQIATAAAAGIAMVAVGLALRLRDRPYASLLAAAGVTVLYMTVFGAHLVHHRIGPGTATALVAAVAAGSLALHAVYREELYVWFAAAGAYAAPVVIRGEGGVGEVALYLAVWNVVYAGYAVALRRRWLAIAALAASLVVFSLAWEVGGGGPEWRVAALFQLAQLVTFGVAFLLLAVRRDRPLALVHTLALFPVVVGFYAFEWTLLRGHAEHLAVPAAVAFALALYAIYVVARARLGRELDSAWLVHAIGAIVLVHAVWLTAVDQAWRPLTGLALAIGLAGAVRVLGVAAAWPLVVGATILFGAGWVQLRFEGIVGPFVLGTPLELAFPALPYALHFVRAGRADRDAGGGISWLLLAVAHGQLLVGSAELVEAAIGTPGTTIERLWLSLAWAAIGVAWLAVAALREDRVLARSTLGIFALFAVKVAFFDLGEAAPLVRVGILAVLGASLYAGGWIYKRAVERDDPSC